MKSRRIKTTITLLAAALLLPAASWAKPQVQLTIGAEKEVTVTENGKVIVKRVPATETVPGETVIFTIHYENTGDETATNVVIKDPIHEETAYVPGSATETGEVAFSIDGGKTYKNPSLLTYVVQNSDGTKEKRVATPEQYTHIRWQIPKIRPGEKGQVSFHVQIQ